ncbi:hypothetical protein [Desulfoscipio gibsoniae]
MRKIEDLFKIRDKLLLAAFAGPIAALAADLSLYLINQAIPGPNVNMPQVTMEFFLNNEVAQSLSIKTLGVIWSTIVGGIYALLYVAALDLTGWNNLWLKAIIIVNSIWLLVAGFIMNLLNIADYARNEPLSITAFYIAHILFATYLYLLVDNFAQQSVLNRNYVEKQSTNLEIFNKHKINKDRLILKPAKKILQQDTDVRFVKTIKPKKIK